MAMAPGVEIRGAAVALTADEVKRLLSLRPLPEEGGFYAETYRSEAIPAEALPAGPSGPRSFGTAIYYLLTRESFSALHRLRFDEVFHFYLGDPVEQLHLRPDGGGRRVVLGQDLAAGMRPQVVVPRGVWQGARLLPGGRQGYALLGTTMAPGFDFADFERGDREGLIAAYPAFRYLIVELTR